MLPERREEMVAEEHVKHVLSKTQSKIFGGLLPKGNFGGQATGDDY
jgi:hypothetical protein